jgi:uncharacterized RDD family membrane protein YckC
MSAPIDTAFSVATPEGVELHLRVAGPVPRALAWLLDLAWRCVALLLIGLVAAPFGGGIATGVLLLSWFALEWLVPAWFEASAGGATPGKRALGLMVVRDDGSPCAIGPALTRNLLRFADFLPFCYFGGLLSMLYTRDFKRLGDLVAGTLVVHAQRATVARRIPAAPPLAPPHALAPDEVRTLLDFAERAPLLGASRALEIAGIAGSLLRQDRGTPLDQVNGLANYLAGTVAHAPD